MRKSLFSLNFPGSCLTKHPPPRHNNASQERDFERPLSTEPTEGEEPQLEAKRGSRGAQQQRPLAGVGEPAHRGGASLAPAPPRLASTGPAWTVQHTHTHAHPHKYRNNSFCFKGVRCHYVLHNDIRSIRMGETGINVRRRLFVDQTCFGKA